MRKGKPIRKKVYGFILQDNEAGEKTLLVYLNVQEESGLKQFKLVKKIGTQNYYKDYIDANVERHDYLLILETRLPEKWRFTGEGEGEDCGTVFNYQWIKQDEIHLLDKEFREYMSEKYIQELFGNG
ncbi:hypothetical protein [Paenibacillus pseudetheri]|uniref:Uncharacterized protein n=1 Tax=Paenibacillus pseudetheri TaxID=2897682 RepID=A0ABN8FDN2_9BACL|nr:hypothetical protein [Paenibacillus pseudetheri]CAH1055974.1 hypothetical protein PAECIP111894_02127 [Paenibacillus pseudetheri]